MSDKYFEDHFVEAEKAIQQHIDSGIATKNEMAIFKSIQFIKDKPHFAPMLFRVLYNNSCPLYYKAGYLDKVLVKE